MTAYIIGNHPDSPLPEKAECMYIFDEKWFLWEFDKKLKIYDVELNKYDATITKCLNLWMSVGYKGISITKKELDNLKVAYL